MTTLPPDSYELLLRATDTPDNLSDEERQYVQQQLQTQTDWQAEYARLAQLRTQLQHYQPQFAPNFADRVLNRQKSAQLTAITKLMLLWFPRVAAAAACVGLFFALHTYLHEGTISIETITGNYISDEYNEESDWDEYIYESL
ncbi:MAG: hypothetical protein IPL33_16495 [Sphingobacteriales bacterium]|nr:hypothetical protein [Sphingobacteriales bacterium]